MAKKTTGKQTSRKGAAKKTTAKRSQRTAKKGTKARSAAKAPARKTTARKTGPRKAAPPQRARRRTAARKTAARAAATRARQRAPQPKAPSKLASAAAVVRGTLAGAVAVVGSRLPWGAGEPDAIEILEREHRRFEQLLKDGEKTTERGRAKRRELLATLAAELDAHELMEEKVFYPALQQHAAAREIVLEGFEEHHVADVIVAELQEVATDDEQWGAKFKVLKENIEHHIQEEEGEMFRTARSIFSRDELRELGQRMLDVRAS